MKVTYKSKDGSTVIKLTDAERKQFVSSEAARRVVADAIINLRNWHTPKSRATCNSV
jgi:hypothetical protein